MAEEWIGPAGGSVLLPLDRQYADYALRMAEVVAALAAAAGDGGPGETGVLQELLAASGDGASRTRAATVRALREVVGELARARSIHAPMHSAHEGWAVLWEEVCELWEAVRAEDPAAQRAEAVQVAAMALRFLTDVVPDAGA